MTRDEFIEAMQRAIVEAPSVSWEAPIDWNYVSQDRENEWYIKSRGQAMAALSAIEAAGLIVVPREPTPEAVGAWYRVKNGFHYADEPAPSDTSDYAAYRALVHAASPLSHKGEGD